MLCDQVMCTQQTLWTTFLIRFSSNCSKNSRDNYIQVAEKIPVQCSDVIASVIDQNKRLFRTSLVRLLSQREEHSETLTFKCTWAKGSSALLWSRVVCRLSIVVNFHIFNLFSETAERNSTKLDRKQDLNVLYQVCVSWADRKNKMASLASDWLRHFWLLLWNFWREFNKTLYEARSQCSLWCLCFSCWWVYKNGCSGRSVKKVTHCTQVHDMWPFGPLVASRNIDFFAKWRKRELG